MTEDRATGDGPQPTGPEGAPAATATVTATDTVTATATDPVTQLLPGELPILPPTADLQDAVGAPLPRRRPPTVEPIDPDRPARSRVGLIAIGVVAAIGIGTLVLLGRANSQRYAITCETKEIVAEQGRGFPPWGTRPLGGDEWKPIAIEAGTECNARSTDDADELAKWYLDALVAQASALLSAREVTKIDLAAQQLDQALLLARSPDRRDERKDIERLQGDVAYWRAAAKRRDAEAALAESATQYDAAAAKRPRHVNDAAAWASYVRKLADELKGGPNGASQTQAAPPVTQQGEPRIAAPPGVALPIEPPPPAAPAPDAGVATGGVLL